MTTPFTYVRPKSVDEVIRHLGAGNARVHAGGTDLLGCLRDGVFTADTVVSVTGLKELKGLGETPEGGLRLGALVPVAEVAENKLVAGRWPALAQAAGAVASPQLRNQGTIGGNLCQKPRCWYYRGDFPCLRKGGDLCYAYQGENTYHAILGGGPCFIVHPSDTASALVAYDAAVTVAGPKGTRRVPVAELHVSPSVDPQRETVLAPDEILTEVLVPPPPPGTRSRYRKVRARQAWDFALAGAALAVTLDGDRVARARVVLSGVAPVPWRSAPAEQALVGERLTPERPPAPPRRRWPAPSPWPRTPTRWSW